MTRTERDRPLDRDVKSAGRRAAWAAGVALGVAALSAGAAGQKPGSLPPVPLTVTFDDSEGQRITSDGLGPYEDGVDGVAASIDQYGNLILNLQTTRTAFRRLSYDYSEPLSGQTTPTGVATGPDNYFSTIRPQDGPNIKMQALEIGQSQCILGGPGYRVEGTSTTIRHSFHRGNGLAGMEGDVETTAFLQATRTGPDSWTIDSVNDCNGYPGVALVVSSVSTKGKTVHTNHGHFNMPMRLSLVRKIG